jgi:hypothetical protein
VNKLTDELTDQACVMGRVFIISLGMTALLCRKPASIGTAAVLRNIRRQTLCIAVKLFSTFFFAITQAVILLIGKLNIAQAI